MKSLVIYDQTGSIFNIIYGTESVPENMDGCATIVDIPSSKRLLSMDVSGDEPKPVFDEQPDTELDRMAKENEVLKAQVAALEDDITNTQVALAEVYESLLEV